MVTGNSSRVVIAPSSVWVTKTTGKSPLGYATAQAAPEPSSFKTIGRYDGASHQETHCDQSGPTS
ncbi:unannotated protein [freshwater metagenome]|uniref:Unannotated protein n=1 Tax=freshwater metagenome TaxID=449393 RepID=A0A6J7L0S7_9ZZZZ